MATRTDIQGHPMGHPMLMPDFAASALPVIGKHPMGVRVTGIALSYADDEADLAEEDRFHLLLVDTAGRTVHCLGPFAEDDVVAIWRDVSAKAGLTRMIVREDGSLVPVSHQIGRVMLGSTRMRRRHAGLGSRRPRFLARRKTGRLPARPQIFRGEDEIIARS